MRGLTEQECEAVQTKAYDLMVQGQATGVSIHSDGPYMCVFDADGEPYAISQENGVFYLSNYQKTMLAHSRQFENILQALEILFNFRPDGTA
jgi:hypothetical protein